MNLPVENPTSTCHSEPAAALQRGRNDVHQEDGEGEGQGAGRAGKASQPRKEATANGA